MKIDWTALATVGLVIVTGWLAYETRNLGEGTERLVSVGAKQYGLNQEQLKLAEKQLQAARESSDLQKDVYYNSIRPVIVGALIAQDITPTQTKYTLQFTNLGRGPAVHVIATINPIFLRGMPAYELPTAPSVAQIDSSREYLLTEKSEERSIQVEKTTHGIVARIDYADVDGKKYYRVYCANEAVCHESGN